MGVLKKGHDIVCKDSEECFRNFPELAHNWSSVSVLVLCKSKQLYPHYTALVFIYWAWFNLWFGFARFMPE